MDHTDDQPVAETITDECDNPSVGKFIATIADGLRHAIRDHGDITKELIGSAAKRVWGRVKGTKYDPFRNNHSVSPARVTRIEPDFNDPPAPPKVVFHLSDGSTVKYVREDCVTPSITAPVGAIVNYRQLHVFDPIGNDINECECGLIEDADLHIKKVEAIKQNVNT